MFPKIGFVMLLTSISFFACSDQIDTDETLATLHNYTGLDGCGWVLEIENGKILEPINLDTFPVQLAEGKDIYITYTLTGGASICMVGDIVEIQTLKE